MFEKYQCAGVYIAIQAVLTLYAQGTLKSRDYHMTTRTQFLKLSSPYGTLGETNVLVGVTTEEAEQFVVERQMLATENLSKLLGFIRQPLLAHLLNHTFYLCICVERRLRFEMCI